jgi:hypothetical protein
MTSEVVIEVEATGAGPSAEFRERITKAIADVVAERLRQDAKWGEQNHPMLRRSARTAMASYDVAANTALLPTAAQARHMCEYEHKKGNGSYVSIHVEEVSEFFEACYTHGETSDEARAEMVQVAAVALAMLEAIDRKRAKVTT